MIDATRPQPTAEEEAQLAEHLGVEDSVIDENLTLSTLKSAIEGEIDDEFASMGEAIRDDLEESLDAALLDSALSELETQIDRLPEFREAGIPDGKREPERLYRELIEPGWRLYDHLVDVGFFESVDENAVRFSAEQIRNTGHGLVEANPLMSEIEEIGFDEGNGSA